MSALWEEEDIKIWQEHLAALPARIQELGKDGLEDLDRWFCEELPSAVAARDPQHLTAQELVKLVDYKLRRGKWRPNLLKYAKAQTEEVVKEITTEAFNEVAGMAGAGGDEKLNNALKMLTDMKGTGVATASVMLSAVSTDVPYMGDEALDAVSGGKKRQYTLKEFFGFVEALKAKANELSSKGTPIHVKDVERALWSMGIAQQIQDRASRPAKRKR